MSNATYAHWINETAFLTATALGSPWLAALWLERKGLLHKPDRLVNALFQVLALRFCLAYAPLYLWDKLYFRPSIFSILYGQMIYNTPAI